MSRLLLFVILGISLPVPAAEAARAHQVSADAVALIVAFEVGSQVRYTARYQGVVCPGGASGPTVGIGLDGGHQSASAIRSALAGHPAVERMAQIMPGAIGPRRCAAARAQLYDVRVAWLTAMRIFELHTLPVYSALTVRTFSEGIGTLSPNARGSLTATVYNRGVSMRGDRRREMRELRDTCVPAGDTTCMAAQYRSMKRLWVGTPLETGLARRYEATARLAEQGA